MGWGGGKQVGREEEKEREKLTPKDKKAMQESNHSWLPRYTVP